MLYVLRPSYTRTAPPFVRRCVRAWALNTGHLVKAGAARRDLPLSRSPLTQECFDEPKLYDTTPVYVMHGPAGPMAKFQRPPNSHAHLHLDTWLAGHAPLRLYPTSQLSGLASTLTVRPTCLKISNTL